MGAVIGDYVEFAMGGNAVLFGGGGVTQTSMVAKNNSLYDGLGKQIENGVSTGTGTGSSISKGSQEVLGASGGPGILTRTSINVYPNGAAGPAAGTAINNYTIESHIFALGRIVKLGQWGYHAYQQWQNRQQIQYGIPQNWKIEPSKKGGGVKYTDPQNPSNSVRIMPGNPKSPYPNSRYQYARWQKNGQYLDKNGNPVSGNSAESHIPLAEFLFK